MPFIRHVIAFAVLFACLAGISALAQSSGIFKEGSLHAEITATSTTNDLHTYELTSNADLRDQRPPDNKISFVELPDHARVRSANVMFDGLYALAISEAKQNSVAQIKDGAYGHGEPLALTAFQTGEFWTYVWTRDLAYSVNLALAGFDPPRAASSLLFKTSMLKPSVTNGVSQQIIQDTGSGGSYPVSSDRLVWILGADATLNYLPAADQKKFLAGIYPILSGTLDQDRKLIFDPADGLYRGEQSFLDWREQTYPLWTKNNVIAIAQSKSLSVNVAAYFALRTASDYAGRLGMNEPQSRYAQWADALKTAINQHFYDPAAGLYSTYIISDGGPGIRAQRYDLLGESLAIVLGVADTAQAKSIISHYPTGPFGPPVVWPEERTIPVYHNHAIWPFVTAWWLKAARIANNTPAMDAGIHSLMRGAAFNLSNMENFDFATGAASVTNRFTGSAGVPPASSLNGPVINSRRQLWSVAGYLSMVQDVVFGFETSADGIRFNPCITGDLRRDNLAGGDFVELQNFVYRGTTNNVRIHLPPVEKPGAGVCSIGRIRLNGRNISPRLIPADQLAAQNLWEIFLEAPDAISPDEKLNLLTADTIPAQSFAPTQPQWDDLGQSGLTAENGTLTLHFHAPAAGSVLNIYRDGKLAASDITTTNWTDPLSTNYPTTTHFYVLEAHDKSNGTTSHLSPSRCFVTPENSSTIPATAMQNHGGQLAEGKYFMNWGRPDHDLLITNVTVSQSGHYLLRAEFSNGAGPVNTGITCAVKKLEVRKSGSAELVSAGYLVMPQSSDWHRFDLSTTVPADLQAGENYSFRIFEDEYSRNMSYLAQNARYTAGNGSGDTAYNYVNLASLHLLRIGP